MKPGLFWFLALVFFLGAGEVYGEDTVILWNAEKETEEELPVLHKTKEEWKEELDPFVYFVTREKGTERPFTGVYNAHKADGIYRCVLCGTDLFDSGTKYDSKTGWPSFYEPVHKHNVRLEDDFSFFMRRTEVLCPRCGAHLGHLFNDGPAPSHKRYCINSAALEFIPR